MSRLKRVVSLMLLVFFAAGSLSAQAVQPKSSAPAYILTLLLGFGTGQYYVGENGNPFLIGELVGYAAVLGGVLIDASANPGGYTFGYAYDYTGVYIAAAGVVELLVFRIWEIVDVFGAVDRARAAGRVALVPVVSIQRTSFEPGVLPVTSYEIGASLQY